MNRKRMLVHAAIAAAQKQTGRRIGVGPIQSQFVSCGTTVACNYLSERRLLIPPRPIGEGSRRKFRMI